jgi:hypothetical protein
VRPALGRLVELEELHGVAGPDPALIVLGDVGIDLVDDRPGIGPFVFDGRKASARDGW